MNRGVITGSGKLDINADRRSAARARLNSRMQQLDGISFDTDHSKESLSREQLLQTLAKMDGRSSVRERANHATMSRNSFTTRSNYVVCSVYDGVKPVAAAKPAPLPVTKPTAQHDVIKSAQGLNRVLPTMQSIRSTTEPKPRLAAAKPVTATPQTVRPAATYRPFKPIAQDATPQISRHHTALANSLPFTMRTNQASAAPVNYVAAKPAANPFVKSVTPQPAKPEATPAKAKEPDQAKPAVAQVVNQGNPFAPLQIKSSDQATSTAKPAKKSKPAKRAKAVQRKFNALNLKRQFEAVQKMLPQAKQLLATSWSIPLGNVAAKPAAKPSKVVAAIAETKAAAKDPVVDNFTINPSGAAAIPAPNLFNRLLGAKISINFKFNRARVLAVARYAVVAVVLGVSTFLAWDTYRTNNYVQNNFGSAAQTMSIGGTNPNNADKTAVSNSEMDNYSVAPDLPRLISIPSIGVKARIRTVGVNSQGNIDTPKNLNDTAWYDGSAKPNQNGQMFIDGHTSFSKTIAAAFNDLGKVQPGDQIFVEAGNRNRFTYRVTGIETVDANKVDMGKVLNLQDATHKGLTLMTCTGKFNYRTQSADKRLIVYAVQVGTGA